MSLIGNFTMRYQKRKLTDLKKNRYIVFRAWLLLFCFAAGQYMVLVHQHKTMQRVAYSASKSQHKPIVTIQEKCDMCDAMHHVAMVLTHHVYYFSVTAHQHIFKQGDYDFVSISLILSSGRAPPVVSAC